MLLQMERLSDIVVTLRAELDQTTLTFAELANMKVGSILRLSRSTGENIDVYVEDVLIGWGEVLLTAEGAAVRLANLRNALLPGFQAEDGLRQNSDSETRQGNHVG